MPRRQTYTGNDGNPDSQTHLAIATGSQSGYHEYDVQHHIEAFDDITGNYWKKAFLFIALKHGRFDLCKVVRDLGCAGPGMYSSTEAKLLHGRRCF